MDTHDVDPCAEVMDGAPVRGESIPVRLFLSPYDLTPTYKNVSNRFSVKYYLNLAGSRLTLHYLRTSAPLYLRTSVTVLTSARKRFLADSADCLLSVARSRFATGRLTVWNQPSYRGDAPLPSSEHTKPRLDDRRNARI